MTEPSTQAQPATPAVSPDSPSDAMKQPTEKEIGGPKETEPTRYGDWTVKGRCIDF